MEIGLIGPGRMGANMSLRLMRAGHKCAVYDSDPKAVQQLVEQGAVGANSVEDLVKRLSKPCAIWLMLPAAAVDPLLSSLTSLLEAGDIVIDGGNSHYQDDIRRAA